MSRVGSFSSLTGATVRRSRRGNQDHREEGRETPRRGAVGLFFRDRDHVVRTFNRSPGGIAVMMTIVPKIGEAVTVTLPAGKTLRGQFCWYRTGRAGIRYL